MYLFFGRRGWEFR